jgi:hypothetical protein
MCSATARVGPLFEVCWTGVLGLAPVAGITASSLLLPRLAR